MRSSIPALPAILVLAGLSFGAMARAPVPKATKETPEVEAYLQAKGWKIAPEARWPSTKKQMTLSIVAPQPKFGFNLAKVEVDDEGYRMLANTQTVEFLDLQYVDCTDAGLATVIDNRALTRISFGGDALTDEGLKKLAGARWLRHVSILSGPKITDGGVRELAELPRLETLELHNLWVTGTCFDAYTEAKALQSLIIDTNSTTDEGARRIAKLPSLSWLYIKHAGKMTTAGVKAIVSERLPAQFNFDQTLLDDDLLKALVAKGRYRTVGPQSREGTKPEDVLHIQHIKCAVTDKGFESLLGCTEAVTIYIDNPAITDATFLKMGGFKKLQCLSLRDSRVTGAGLSVFADAPIHTLDLWDCPLREDSFKAIGQIAKLNSLTISKSRFEPDWVKHLTLARDLKRLDARNTGFDDVAAKHLADMPNLYHLDLQSTKLSDKGFADLLKLPKLNCLNVDHTLVTKDAFLKAKMEYPKVILSHFVYDR